jgi:hypothetical protein
VVFPLATLSFDDDGTGLDLNVVQSFSTDGGPVCNRSLGTQWSLRDDALTETACRIVGRDLTVDEWAEYIGDSVPTGPPAPPPDTCPSGSGPGRTG